MSAMFLYGVVNASPDSLNTDSIVDGPDAALARARRLLADGANGIDLGGQGSTDIADVVSDDVEWERLAPLVGPLAALGVPLSVDTWRPSVARRALEAGATVLNAADGLQQDEMLEVAAEAGCEVVLPFLSGPDPKRMALVEGDPVEVLVDFFTAALARCDRYGIRDRVAVDPGTGFAPPHWPWEQRFVYQKQVYNNLGRLRTFGRPLYIALPWKDTVQHAELLDIVVRQAPELGRCHYPTVVRAAEARAHA
ncbi:MAG: dihydropteroate synthase [Actinomycetota bacterium]|nr:dihydropteroate synthase [Actinomycetota bacterium]